MPKSKIRAQRQITLKEILEILKQKGDKSIEIAQKAILKERIKSNKVSDAIQYYFNSLIDPTPAALLILSCETVGRCTNKIFTVGAAITLLFGAIDIHDDVLDKSTSKDGNITVYGKFGEEIAILIGNAFLFEGFSLLNTATRHMDHKKADSLFEILKKAFFEMGDGHALEASLKGKLEISPEEYMCITKMKAASWEAVTKIGALIGNGKKHEIKSLARYGRIWGMLSTIRNDFIDMFDINELKNRTQNEILPLPILYAFENAAVKEKIFTILSKKRMTEKDIANIIDLVFNVKQVKTLKERLHRIMLEGASQLSIFKKSQTRNILETFILAMLEDLE